MIFLQSLTSCWGESRSQASCQIGVGSQRKGTVVGIVLPKVPVQLRDTHFQCWGSKSPSRLKPQVFYLLLKALPGAKRDFLQVLYVGAQSLLLYTLVPPSYFLKPKPPKQKDPFFLCFHPTSWKWQWYFFHCWHQNEMWLFRAMIAAAGGSSSQCQRVPYIGPLSVPQAQAWPWPCFCYFPFPR